MPIISVFKALYSPFKAFREIVKKPDIKGPMLILLLTVLVTAGAQYVSASKMFFENRTPETDWWTEDLSLWESNGVLLRDTDRLVGNYSMSSSVSNDTHLWMRLTATGSFDLSGYPEYESLSFRVRWGHQEDEVSDLNATLRLLSHEIHHYFEYDFSHNMTELHNRWGNLTVPSVLGQGWIKVNSPDWKNITGFEFQLDWSASNTANPTLKIDDLYLGKYVSPLESDILGVMLINALTGSATDFIVRWILYAGLFLVLIKIFEGETGLWRVLFNVTGYVFIVTMVYIAVDALLISLLPPLSFPLRAWSPIAGEEGIGFALWNQTIQDGWGMTLAYNSRRYLPYFIHMWTTALGSIAIHFTHDFSWKKAIPISVMAYLMLVFVRALLPI